MKTLDNNYTEAILDNILDAVLVVDGDGIIIYANRAAFKLFGKTPKELLHQSFGFPVLLYEVQEINLLKGGELLTVQMLASAIESGDKKASLLSLRDITSQKQLMLELEEQTKLLEKKNDENAEYASLASHDLKEPVRKILMYTDILLGSNNKPSGDINKIEKIHGLATRMNHLINGIAELSRIDHTEHEFQQVDLKQIVSEVSEDLELTLKEKSGEIITGELPVIEAVPDKIYQLFLNLISNSLKYARENVKPCIQIQCELIDDENVKITFADNGIGFNNDYASELFKPFKRLHSRDYDGIGIGLTLCHRIVEIHRGQISAQGVAGEGACFVIYLPKYQNANTA